MAGIFASMPNLNNQQQWTNLLNNLPSALETKPSLESMKEVLLLSYNHLPYFINPCFLYLSIFPEYHLIKRKYLIQLWVAEGLVSNQYDMSTEVVAEYYFNELVGRSLILPSAVGWNGKVKSCRIHDLMVDVLVFKSKEENMISIISKHSRTTLRAENVIRRLSLQGESNPIRCIPNDVDLSRSADLCTRREYARWLVKENYKGKPTNLIAGSVSPAFADVNVNDSDFWCLQALGEAGEVQISRTKPPLLDLRAHNLDASPQLEIDLLSGDGSIVTRTFEVSHFDVKDDNVLSDHYGPDWEKRIELKELHANVDQLCCLSRFYKKAYHQLFKSYDAAEVELRRMMEIINKLIANVLKKKPCHASKCKNKKKRGEKRKFSKEKVN
ncbi:hypothetical protein IEQ34_006113 [Dendrobium chrysotoxum]|uniref:Disease resistance protein winged helix domain-containing protein n=1 Tax=Dendrobium chrysotoxum TaxID=161865 RepID=A0AAV7HF18_DENCH|nr:hypothetical protein IEQ34_006113 [Dendrobium chrysotoxum]